MTPLWQRPSQNQAQSRYHATTNGTPICGARIRVAMTRPRELTGRQIETQGCKSCIKKTNEGDAMTKPYLIEIIDDAETIGHYLVNLAEGVTDKELGGLTLTIEDSLGPAVWVSINPLTPIPNLIPVREIPSFVATDINTKESN